MKMKGIARIQPWLIISLLILAVPILVSCESPVAQQATAIPQPTSPTEEEAHGHKPEAHVAGHHEVPHEAAERENPVPANGDSVAAGAAVFAENCAVCHGENGEGDGPAAESLAEKPANLHAQHVQENSAGALFWIITHGRPESPMPPWGEKLTETERWHVVNYLRTFGEGETSESAEHEHDEGAKEDHHHEDEGVETHEEGGEHTHEDGSDE